MLALVAACAGAPKKKRSIVDEVKEGNIQIQTVLDLARNSYLKGCVDGKNIFAAEINRSAFETCRDEAKKHEAEIKSILEQNPPLRPAP